MEADFEEGEGGGTPLQDEPEYDYSIKEGDGSGDELDRNEEEIQSGNNSQSEVEGDRMSTNSGPVSPPGSPPMSQSGEDGPDSPIGNGAGSPHNPPMSPVYSDNEQNFPQSPGSPVQDESGSPYQENTQDSQDRPYDPDSQAEESQQQTLADSDVEMDQPASPYDSNQGSPVNRSRSPSPTGSATDPRSPASHTQNGSRSQSPTGSQRSRSGSPAKSRSVSPSQDDGQRSRSGSPARSRSGSQGSAKSRSRSGSPVRSQSGSPARSRSGSRGSRSRSGSPGDRSRSGSPARSRSGSPGSVGQRSRSGSPVRSRSGSRSPAGSRSRSGSPARSRSGSGSPGRSRSGSPAGSRSRSRSPARSRSGSSARSRSGSRASRSRSGSPAGSRSRSRSPAGSRSRSRSPAGSRSRSGSPAGSGSRSGSPAGSNRSRSRSGSRASDRSRSRSRSGSRSRSVSPAGSGTPPYSPLGSRGSASPPQSPVKAGSEKGESDKEALVADIFGSSDEEEEFEGFGEADVEATARKKEKKTAILSDDEGEGMATGETTNEPVIPELSDDENDAAARQDGKDGAEFVSDFDLMMAKKKEEMKKRRRKRKDFDLINDSDDLIADMINKMKVAAEEDRGLNMEKKPAIRKLKYLPTVVSQLKKADLHGAFLDCGILGAMTEWLAPLPDKSLPNLQIREHFLKILGEFPTINPGALKTSGIGKAVMYLYKHPKEIKENKEKAGKLINDWSRPLFNLTSNYKSLSKEEREQRDYDQLPKRRRTSMEDGGMTPRKDLDKSLTGEQKALRPGDPGWIYRARVPLPSNKDYVIRPKWKTEEEPDDEEGPSRSVRKSSKKEPSRYEKHARKFAERKKNSKSMRAVTISIEGRNMAL